MQRSQQLRTATQTRRSARTGFPEPDDFEGLPVRQWRQEWVNVAPSLPQESNQQADRWAVELPFGMPKESHLLPPHTQELLRAARSGRLYKRAAPAEEEEPDPEVDAVKGEKKEWEPPSEGYMVKLWKQVPRTAENPTVSHLAKRHKNTVTLTARAAAAPVAAGPTVIRATVRRIDAAGNPYEQTVTLSEGQQVDGEIISTTVVPAPSAAAGALPVQQATPARRRPPPPKRKAKGIGRGRKKGRLPLPLPATRSQATTADGALPVKSEGMGADGVKIEDVEDSTNQDSEMADMLGIPSEDEEGEGGEGEGEDEDDGEEEGADDEAGETPDLESSTGDAPGQETEDSEMSEVVQPTTIEEPDDPCPAPSEVDDITIHQVPSLANLGQPHLAPPKAEGSPLKNVMVQSPTEPSPLVSPQVASASLSASGYLDVHSRTTMTMDSALDNSTAQAYVTETTVVQEPLARPTDGTNAEEAVSGFRASEALPAASAGEPTDIATPAPDQPQEETGPSQPAITEPIETINPTAETPTDIADIKPDPAAQTASVSNASIEDPPDSPALLPTVAEDEDDGLNLLGSLERELDRQEGMSNTSGGSSEGKVTPTNDDAVPAAAEAVPAAAAASFGGEATAVADDVGDEEENVKAPLEDSGDVAVKDEPA